ncbi:Fum13p [Fusarium nygamai]|uniref:Fum13p n=2 Tax=Gibberella nygamai TaxID=42673 RepID=A0A2K0WCX2_GIBNY|nr:Fum13p [Fusarium nygamai]
MNRGQDLVLLTGATGHVGYAVLVKTLQAGYNVRATLRDMSRADAILSSGPVQEALSTQNLDLSFVHVPDFTAPDAFGLVLSNVTHVVHVASALRRGTSTDLKEAIIDVAVQGTRNILRAAQNCPSVRRVVITSSTSAIVDQHPVVSQSPADRCVTPLDRHADYDAEYYKGDSLKAYTAAKTAALNATDAFLATADGGPTTLPLHFDVINIMPSFMFGPKGLAATPFDVTNGSNIFGIGLVMRHKPWDGIRLEAVCCHVDDVAQVHVNALDDHELLPLKAGAHRDFILGVKFKPEEVGEIVRRRFPREWWESESATFGARGTYEWYHTDYDVGSAERLLGRPFKGLEEQIYDSGSQVLEKLKGMTIRT